MEISSLLQELAGHGTRELPPYGLQQPFRWTADVAVVEAFELGVLDLSDFYFTGDDYRYRLETDAKRCFLDLLRERFNAGVRYNDRTLKWDTVVEQKAIELGRFLFGRVSEVSFLEPCPNLCRTDNRELRKRILSLGQFQVRTLDLGRNTVHYLRKRARDRNPFTIYEPVLAKLRK